MAFVALLALALPAAGDDGRASLTIHITDHADVRGLEKAQAYVERVFASAGVRITWADPAVRSCEGLNLFLARTSPGGSAMGRSAVADGVAWVFANRVLTLAAAKNMDERILLGRAIVHELGHLLLLDHARDGVMRAEIYTEAMEGRFAFTPKEGAGLRAAVARRAAACRELLRLDGQPEKDLLYGRGRVDVEEEDVTRGNVLRPGR